MAEQSTYPKVSCIMPVKGRSEMLERAIDMYKAQTYRNIELIIYESEARIPSFTSEPYHINHVKTSDSPPIGMARNKAIAWANGDIIVHLDSDDYYAPDWVAKSVEMLIESKADLVGLKDGYFYHPATNTAYFFTNRDKNKQHVLMGATMCYWRKTWEDSRYPLSFDHNAQGFRNVKRGEDADFCEYAGAIALHDYYEGFCAIRHGANTSKDSILTHPFFKKIDSSIAEKIINNARPTQKQSAA